jgi:ribonucleoside-diphosphate reductase alpha chain
MAVTWVLGKSGEKKQFDAGKITEKTLLACDGIDGVSPSEIEIRASSQFHNGISTDDIQKILIKTAADLISEEEPGYDVASARLLNQQLRKEAYGQYTPKSLFSTIVKNTDAGIYGDYILNNYTQEEIEYYGSKIRYDKDDKFSYAGLKQLYEKYLIRRDGKVIESPQDVNMLIHLVAFAKLPDRKYWIVEGYRIVSDFEVSHPTPTMIGMRTPFQRYISCNGINFGDSTESISRANYAITKLTASRSGLGMGVGSIRGLGGDIGNGRVKHTGIIPITKAAESLTKSFSQEMRGGGGTTFMPFFHWEIEDYLVLKNNKGTEENRVRGLDHSMQVNRLFYKRVVMDEDITLFHMNDVPGLYEAMGNNDKFEAMYEMYENRVSKKKKKVMKAKELWNKFKSERFQTARDYLINQDNFNEHSAFNINVEHSNLCLEINLPNTPLDGSKGEPEIFACILMSHNWGYLKDDRIPIVSEYSVRFLEEVIELQEYAMPEVEYAARKRRALGIGISDVFHWLAKNKIMYNTQEGRNAVHKRMEATNYNLLKVSNKLAKERGRCELYDDTKFSKGLLNIDTYKRTVDELVTEVYHQDWDTLRKDIAEFGLRHSTLMAVAPTANSSRVSNSTPGVEPPRKLLNIKEDNKIIVKQLVPDYSKLKNYYTTAWSDDFNNIDYFKMLAVIQKFVCQAISVNQYADLTRYDEKGYPDSLLTREYMIHYYYGGKTLYYQNFRTTKKATTEDEEDNGEHNLDIEKEDEGCESGGCKI